MTKIIRKGRPFFLLGHDRSCWRLLIFLGLFALLGCTPATPTAPSGPPSADLSEEPSLGDPNAPVTIEVFSDFQCPYCARFALETFPLIRENYIDSGQVRFVFRDFPLPGHEQADEASLAANCAGEQGQFWAMHDTLFEKQGEWSGNPQAVSLFQSYAQSLGLDTSAFSTCADSGKYYSEIENDLREGIDMGVTGTPTFFLNGQPLVGAYPFSEFQRIIEEKLAS